MRIFHRAERKNAGGFKAQDQGRHDCRLRSEKKKSFFTLRLRFINFNDEPLIAVEIFVVPLNDMRYLSMTILGAT